MKLQSLPINAIILVAILALSGVKMMTGVVVLRQGLASQEKLVNEAETIGYVPISGIDVFGKVIDRPESTTQDTDIVFSIHSQSFAQDVNFWRTVSNGLSKHTHLRLIGLCNDHSCADLARHDGQGLAFPLLEYGEFANTEAVLNADANNSCVVWSPSKGTKRLVWRTPDSSPSRLTELLEEADR